MTCEFPCAPGRDNVQCECLFLSDGDYSASRSNQIAIVIAGLEPAIHLIRKKMVARVNPRIKSGDAHDAERTAGGVKSRVIRGPVVGLKNPLTDGIREVSNPRPAQMPKPLWLLDSSSPSPGEARLARPECIAGGGRRGEACLAPISAYAAAARGRRMRRPYVSALPCGCAATYT